MIGAEMAQAADSQSVIATFGDPVQVQTASVASVDLVMIFESPNSGKESRDRSLMATATPQDMRFTALTTDVDRYGIAIGSILVRRLDRYRVVQPPQPDEMGSLGLTTLICAPI